MPYPVPYAPRVDGDKGKETAAGEATTEAENSRAGTIDDDVVS